MITFFDIALTLDGFIAGENRSPQNPMGGQGPVIHNWMFVQKAFWETHGMETSHATKDDADGDLIRSTFARIGANIMGKRMFDEGEASWPEGLFKCPVYVLTHDKREPWVQKDNTTFFFINDGIESAWEKAKASAGNKDIRISGGADCIQQYLNKGYIDEFTLHITPVLIGSGIRFFDQVDRSKFDLRIVNTVQSPLTTHITYKVNYR